MDRGSIPLMDLAAEHQALREELTAAFLDVLDSGAFILGPQVAAFEEEMARHLGVRHAIGVNSGTDALVLALRAADIGPGDEVVTTPFTFFATAEAISILGATPVFVDIDPVSFNIDLGQVAAGLTPRTRALVPVHLFGNPVDMEALESLALQHGLAVIEDTAQALGATWKDRAVGTMGTAGAFSFFPSKNLGGLGDGGLVATDDDAVAERVRMLRTHGGRRKYHNEILGYNSRLDELQAAFLRVKLRHLDANNEGRRRVADHYGKLLADVDSVVAPTETPGGRHVYHQYTVRIEDRDRDAVAGSLAAAGVATAVYYPVPVHQLPVYEGVDVRLPQAETAAREVLSLPIWPSMSETAVERVVTRLDEAVRHAGSGGDNDSA